MRARQIDCPRARERRARTELGRAIVHRERFPRRKTQRARSTVKAAPRVRDRERLIDLNRPQVGHLRIERVHRRGMRPEAANRARGRIAECARGHIERAGPAVRGILQLDQPVIGKAAGHRERRTPAAVIAPHPDRAGVGERPIHRAQGGRRHRQRALIDKSGVDRRIRQGQRPGRLIRQAAGAADRHT